MTSCCPKVSRADVGQGKQKVPARRCATTEQRAVPDNTDNKVIKSGNTTLETELYCGACGSVLSRQLQGQHAATANGAPTAAAAEKAATRCSTLTRSFDGRRCSCLPKNSGFLPIRSSHNLESTRIRLPGCFTVHCLTFGQETPEERPLEHVHFRGPTGQTMLAVKTKSSHVPYDFKERDGRKRMEKRER